MAKKLNLRVHDYDVGGKKIKKNKTQEISENSALASMSLCKIILKPNQKTKPETLETQEKICFFVDGHGMVTMNGQVFTVQPKEVLLIPVGTTYSIENYASIDLHYNVVSTT